MAVVGSGIMGERLSGGNVALALLANSVATGAALLALILAFGPVSGAHFNPAVTLADALQGGMGWREVPVYVAAQIAGAFAGVGAAHEMFGLPLFFASHHRRSGGALLGSEAAATFGLLCVIWGCARARGSAAPFAVGVYRVYFVRESRGDAGPCRQRHIRRDWSRRCARIRRCAIAGYRRGGFVFSLDGCDNS
jgi:glycerol uptake facilitator-like aquaporin